MEWLIGLLIFGQMIGWLQRAEMRDRIRALERRAVGIDRGYNPD